MVSESESVEKSLKPELEDAKLELLRTQARLHRLQEDSVAEAAFVQLRAQYLQVQYELWVMKACVAWTQGERLRLTHCLEASLDCTTLETQAMVADWLKRLDQFAGEMEVALANGPRLALEALLITAEWKALMKRVVADRQVL